MHFYINMNVLKAMAVELANAFEDHKEDPNNETEVENVAKQQKSLEKWYRTLCYFPVFYVRSLFNLVTLID